jgi:hypothetical protein
MLAKIKSLNDNQKAMIRSIGFVHNEVLKIKNNKITGRPRVPENSSRWGADTLRGDLTLEYGGAIADTRATFMLDKE